LVLVDAGYGCNADLSSSVSALGLTYVGGILSHTTHGRVTRGPAAEKVVGLRPSNKTTSPRPQAQPIAVKELALKLPKHAWCTIN
jgi:DDE superfamily endonuclease